MGWVRVWIHMVFSTKYRKPFFNTPQSREVIFSHTQENSNKKGIYLEAVNGHQEHIHCLISLNKTQSISETAQLVKGESSFWINKNKITKEKFTCQDDYWAVGVSESHLESVKKYIRQQELHHQKKTFTQEIDEFMQKDGWEILKG